MSDDKKAADWLADWQAMQQRYWTSMGELARQAGESLQKSQPAGMPSWHEGLEIWARAFQGGRNGQGELIERALEHGKAYLDTLQRIGGIAARPLDQTGPEDWSRAFSDLMHGLMPGITTPGFETLKSATAQGARGVEQMMAELQPMLAMFLGEARAVLGIQPFGMAREHQERQQALAAAVLDYQQASARYQALLAKSLARGIEIFEGKLAERSEPGRQIESPRALYDLWIDAAEEGYAEVAMSQAFQDAYGELVNSQMRVRQLLQDQVERMSRALGMPTRSEIDSVHRRLAALRREQAAGESMRALSAEIARLRADLESIAARSGDRGVSAVAKSRAKSAVKAPQKKPSSKATAEARGRATASGGRARGAAAARKRKLSR
jgi:class III poly(R)-hydroxyalkanoic acid synthase PhaE subunit